MKLTCCLYRKGTWLKLRTDTVVTVAVELTILCLPVRLVGETTKAVHQRVLGGADVSLVPLLGGHPVHLGHGGVGVQVAVHYGDSANIHGYLVVLQAPVVAHRAVWKHCVVITRDQYYTLREGYASEKIPFIHGIAQ